MTPVGGSRHYAGAGLGQIGMWGCPSCGEDNTGPLTGGCVHCGAGRPPVSATPGTTLPPPPATPPAPEPAPARPAYDDHQVEQGDVADYWARQHADVSIAEAYRAGYLDGARAARAAQGPPPPAAGMVSMLLSTPKTWRTAIVALELFRDQVLTPLNPEEIASGEWLSAPDVDTVIGELQQLLANSEEPAHAL